MKEQEFDVVVIGMGPGGEHVAEALAGAGLAVAGIESRLTGGECPYWGCVPSKMMIRASGLLTEGRRIPGMAGESVITPDWGPVAKRIRAEATDNWDDQVAVDRFTGLGGTFFRGYGVITGARQVTVGDEVLRARRGIVINPGTSPAVPPIPGLAGTPFWTNHEAIEDEELPDSLIVLGGGPIGVELSQVFARFGTVVTVVEMAHRLLAVEEPESGDLLAKVFARDGIDVRTGATAAAVAHDGAEFTVTLADGGGELRAERLLVATGRRTDLAGLGIGAVGLDETGRTIPADSRMRALDASGQPADGIWVIGDIVGRGAFTHLSMYHSDIVIAEILGRPHHEAEYHAVPRVTFTDPEIGSVGLSEAGAREAGLDVRVAITPLPESPRGWIHKAGNDGFIKLVADAGRGVLVGASSVGPTGGEVLSMLTLAVHADVPVQRLSEMIYAYPTFHRAVSAAVIQLLEA
jgi:pyruvate/2-oxoglutarate dehydrogenase complex dihydrolipoamide dehydrogenase (E3) component